MSSDELYFNSKEAAKILGVNVSSIKRWTEEGRLECVKTPGGHRKFFINHLEKFLKENKKQSSRVNLFPVESKEDLELGYKILKKDINALIELILKKALACNRAGVLQVLNGLYLGEFPVYDIYDQILTPVFHQIGSLWEQNKITIAEEHLASQAIRDSIIRLQGIIRLPSKHLGKALCLNLASELHDTALKMVDHVLELRGYHVLYSGQITPMLNAEQLFEKFQPERIYISSTFVDDVPTIQKEFDQICQVAIKFNSKVFIGGQGFDQLKVNCPQIVMRLYNFHDAFVV